MSEDYKKLQEEMAQLQTQFQKLQHQYQGMYDNVNRLLLWKSSLKVRVNEACPFPEIVGKEGYVGDLFPDGYTVVHYQEDGELDFWRLQAEYLDVVEWDNKKFTENMEKLNYHQVKGVWKLKE